MASAQSINASFSLSIDSIDFRITFLFCETMVQAPIFGFFLGTAASNACATNFIFYAFNVQAEIFNILLFLNNQLRVRKLLQIKCFFNTLVLLLNIFKQFIVKTISAFLLDFLELISLGDLILNDFNLCQKSLFLFFKSKFTLAQLVILNLLVSKILLKFLTFRVIVIKKAAHVLDFVLDRSESCSLRLKLSIVSLEK